MDPIAFSVRNWQFSTLVLLLLAALGFQAWSTTPRTEDPPFSAPTFVVLAVMPGAPPSQVEALLADPLEDRISAMDDLKRVRSTILDGAVSMQVEFELDADPDEQYAAVLREVDAARPELPDELDRIEVRQLRPSDVAVLQYAIVADTAPLAVVRATAEAVQTALDSVAGVRKTEIVGLPDEEVDVAIDTDALGALGIPVGQVLGAIAANDARIPGGHVDRGERRLTVTPDAAFEDLDALEAIVVADRGGAKVHLGDLATIGRHHADAETLTRLDGHRAVWVTAQFDEKANVFAVRDAAVDAVRAVPVADGVEIALGFDQSVNVAHRLSGFTRDFTIAIALVLLTLLPLGLRAANVVMVSIPLSLAVGLAGLGWSGSSINQLSIVGFVIALGLLVDDAIVVVENVSRHLREGKSPIDAAIDGTKEIALAVIGCTATLLLAFLPLLFLPGTAGMFIRSLPLAVTFTVLASLGISLTVVPLLASRWLRPQGEHGNAVLRLVDRGIEATYARVLDRA
ncbi:MAG: efflux RND transporter permease subunit, partial [Myxococcota bacterium]